MAATVQHPSLVPIEQVGEHEGRHYLVMPEVEGRTLQELIENGGRGVEQTSKMVQQVGGALDELHSRALVHRDVKPSNVIVESGSGAHLLTDFGLVKGVAYTVLTRSGEVLGTIDYLAPEIIEGGEASPQSDLYSLGCTAFACLTGQPPFAGQSIVGKTMSHLREPPPDPSRGGACGPEFSLMLRRALAKDPANRPSSATSYSRAMRIAAKLPAGGRS